MATFPTQIMYEPIINSFAILDEVCNRKSTITEEPFCSNFSEVFLEFVYDIIRVQGLTSLKVFITNYRNIIWRLWYTIHFLKFLLLWTKIAR
jgi:hypothetical protein